MTDVLVRRDPEAQTLEGRVLCDDGASSTSQGRLRTAAGPGTKGRAWNRWFPTAFRERTPGRHLDFRLPASRAVRE